LELVERLRHLPAQTEIARLSEALKKAVDVFVEKQPDPQ
jgi:hypothetical protein